MKYVFVLAFCFTIACFAQENWASARLLCQTEDSYRVQVNVAGDVDTVILVPSHDNSNIVWALGEDQSRQFEISLDNEYLALIVYATHGIAFNADTLMLDEARFCESASEAIIPVPVNECLGIDPTSLGLEAQGTFTVDGNNYHYADNLSFIVPAEIVWSWDVLVDGEWILSFAQSETEACHITSVRGTE